MTAYSRERANGVPTRFIDVSEHPRIKRIALGIDAQDGQTAITIHGYTANGEAIVLEHAVVENGSAVVHYGVETGGRKPLSEIVERFKPEGLFIVSDADLNAEDVPERYRRYRQADRLRRAMTAITKEKGIDRVDRASRRNRAVPGHPEREKPAPGDVERASTGGRRSRGHRRRGCEENASRGARFRTETA